MTGTVSVVIPAFNEAATIAVTIAETREYFSTRRIPFEIIVVAEGSDGTARIAREAAALNDGVRVIAGERRRGKGAAVREGVLAATGDVIGFMDADRKTPVAELDKILPRLRDVPVVIGSRSAAGARIGRHQNLLRRAGSRFFSVYLHVVLGLREIPDTQCGLKFFRADIARQLFDGLIVSDYVFDVELLYVCLRRGIPIEQVGVEWSDDGDSRLSVVAGNVRNLFDVFRIALRYRIGNAAVRDSKWPKRPPLLSAAQLAAREQFVREWLELLPERYGFLERFNHSVAKLPHKSGSKTLEIGAGLGEHLRYERTDQDYHCLEYREELCRTLTDRIDAARVHRGDIQRRQDQWADKSFDRVIAIHVLEHLPSLPDAIREISRLLKDDGVFDVVLPCEGGVAYWLARKMSAERLFRRRFKMDYGPIIRSEHVNTHAEVIGLLRRFFKVERVRFFPTFIPMAAINLVAAYRLTSPRSEAGQTLA